MKKFFLTSKQRTTVIAVVLASSGVFAGYKVVEYSADPVGEKDCPPLAADAATVSADELAKLPPPAATPALPWARQGGTINDASCLNRTAIYGIVQVRSVDDIKNALQFAKDNRLKVSIAGVRHSMGGQAFFKDALVLDKIGRASCRERE